MIHRIYLYLAGRFYERRANRALELHLKYKKKCEVFFARLKLLGGDAET